MIGFGGYGTRAVNGRRATSQQRVVTDGVRPILVTGSHRSGSTWVGRMLSTAPDVTYIHEPFSIHHRPGICDVRFGHWFPYICCENEDRYVAPVRDMLEFRYKPGAEARAARSSRDVGRFVRDWARFSRARRRETRPLVKDPIAVFSAEWLSARFDVAPVILTRHPAAFASSLKQLQWTHPFGDFLAQPLLMRDVLAPFDEEIRTFAAKEHPILEQAILLWKLIHHAIARYRRRQPDWVFVRHEDLARNPLPEFERLFARLDLAFEPASERQIREHSAPSNPAEVSDGGVLKRDSRASISTWRTRLSDEEIGCVRNGVGSIAAEFYTDADW